ncbi:unnamed protein product [Caenorhabditis sp. 36 PRJEB53466]|nr:unnamed protein product [Caenorhabditis sp. 36 PRJEB53466]
MEGPYSGLYGNNMLSPRYIVTSPAESYVSQPSQHSQQLSPEIAPTYYQIQPPAPREMVIIRTTTITRNTTSIQPIHSTF